MTTLIFTNSFGDLFKDKICLKDNKIEIDLNYIVKFKLYCVYQTKAKILLLLLSITVLFLSIFLINYLLLYIGCFLIVSVVFYDAKKYYLKIKTKNINDDYILLVNKMKIEDAKIFVYEVDNFKKRINFDIELGKSKID